MRGNVEDSVSRGLAVILMGILAGCANPGPPKAPSLQLPKQVADLSAQRVGDSVLLGWTTPGETTDGIAVRGRMTAEVCEATAASGGVCRTQKKLEVRPGPTVTEFTLPASDSGGALRAAGFRVKLLNAAGRSAGDSRPTLALVGVAPAGVAGLHATVVREGALLQWQAVPGDGVVEVNRRLETIQKTKPPSSKAPRRSGGDIFGTGSESGAPAEVRLKAGAGDRGGMVDRTVVGGQSYSYVAQRVQWITVGGQKLEARSAASAAVDVTMRDVFPPAVPHGLEAVVSSGAASKEMGIDLSWEPVSDADLAGYVVYRQEVGGDGKAQGERIRLTSAPVQEPGYRDATAVAGQRYAYSVSAVDSAGNESGTSAVAVEEMNPSTP